ncbi:MAG: DUF1588 domain-containing protein [Deltaproteobacteria bacterium]|nr:DUF1588 domain-containing protein [Deltaproteobacteria bacterium]
MKYRYNRSARSFIGLIVAFSMGSACQGTISSTQSNSGEEGDVGGKGGTKDERGAGRAGSPSTGDPRGEGGGTLGQGGADELAEEPRNPFTGEEPLSCDKSQSLPLPRRLWRLTPMQYRNTVHAAYAGRGVLGVWKNGAPARIDALIPFDGVNKADRYSNYAGSFTMSDRELWYAVEAAADLARQFGGSKCATVADDKFAACIRERVSSTGEILFSRPLLDAELDLYSSLATDNVAALGKAEALILAYQGLLASPSFLFRSEIGMGQAPEDGRVRLSMFEIAAALSYSLTDMPPDPILYDLAKAGKLDSKDAIAQQVERLLTLPMQKDVVRPTLKFFREYFHYENAPASFKEVTWHKPGMLVSDTDGWFDNLIRTSGRKDFLTNVLTSNVMMVQGYTSRNYDLELDNKVQSTLMLLNATQRAGILTQPSFLVAFSQNEHTQPVQRGRFVRESLLCGVVPSLPGGNVPPLPDLGPNPTFRAIHEAHSKNPTCYACHKFMDPLGLAFESYDDLGRYRTMDGIKPVDASGVLEGASPAVDGAFDGVVQLSQKLAKADVVRQCFVVNNFRFWSGRGEDLRADGCTLLALDEAFKRGGDYVAMLNTFFSSDAFLQRKAN